MKLRKIFKSIPLLLVVCAFAWTLYYILTYDPYYHGEPLKNVRITFAGPPQFHFGGITRVNYYYFTSGEYPGEFRITEGAVELVRKNEFKKEALDLIEPADSAIIEIRESDILKLDNPSSKIAVIGMSINDHQLIDPIEVKTIDRNTKQNRQFYNYLFLGVLAIIGIRLYVKKDKRASSPSTDSEKNPSNNFVN